MKCPKCKAKLAWGYPAPDVKARYNRETEQVILNDDVIWCGCVIYEKNHCPVCGALVFEDKTKQRR